MSNFVKTERVNYYNKDFATISSNLIAYAKSYFPYAGTDFTPASPSMMFVEMAAYVGDLLSYYLDKQIQETFITTATERENIVQIANLLGYSHKNITPASVTLTVKQIIPATGEARSDPDYRYALRIEAGAIIRAAVGSGVSFRTLYDIDFNNARIENVFEIGSDSLPTYYILAIDVPAVASFLNTETFSFGLDTPPNSRIVLSGVDVIDVLDVVDSNGNVWYEVPYLSQQTVLRGVRNDSDSNNTLSQHSSETPYLLESVIVDKKFIKRVRSDNYTELIFGSGVTNGNDLALYPNQENLNASFYSNNINNMMVDPNNFMYFNSTGQIPRDITLTVRYYYGGGYTSNVAANTITDIVSLTYIPINESILVQPILNLVKSSLVFNNIGPALGGRGAETDEEIRQNAMAFFNAQNRCVTAQDYTVRTLSLPQKFGNIAKSLAVREDYANVPLQWVGNDVSIAKGNLIDGESRPVTNNTPLNVNLYCLSYDSNKNFVQLNDATLINLKSYLDIYRMMTDSITIKKTAIINIGIDFEIIVSRNYNGNDVLLKCILELTKYFDNDNMQINKPIYMSDIYTALSLIDGVQSVKNVSIYNKSGGIYSNNVYPINDRALVDGIIYPAKEIKSIFEVKDPKLDIKGKIGSY